MTFKDIKAWFRRWNAPVPKNHMRLFFYGSLKPGFYNFHGLEKTVTVVQKDIVEGYTLVGLGSYPGAIAGTPEDHVVGFVVDVPNAQAKGIDDMERRAGYDGVPVRTRGGLDVVIYHYLNPHKRPASQMPLIGPIWTLDHQNGKRPGAPRAS